MPDLKKIRIFFEFLLPPRETPLRSVFWYIKYNFEHLKGLPRGGSNGFPKNTKLICEYINSTICVVFIPPTTILNVSVGLLYSKLISI